MHFDAFMAPGKTRTMDGNEAVASVAYRLNEVISIYPITPASPMGELCDEWAAASKPNLWNGVPTVIEMQSEGGAAGAIHGALQSGALATTFTASQGLLLMLPNMYKMAGELESAVIHVATRTVATHALSIFCDHSDVMACRQTGFAMLASSTVQQAHDFACIAQAATLRARVPFLHFFDGFRTSHELVRVQELSDDDLRALVDHGCIDERRRAALTPDRPTIRGTAQNPDTFFQAREAANRFYSACPSIIEEEMARFAARTGRVHAPYEYVGHPDAQTVVVAMGSASCAVEEAVRELSSRGRRVGMVRICLYRPFLPERFVECLPPSVSKVAVLDRTKEPGAIGEPLYLDVSASVSESSRKAAIDVIGGRYGLSSKEFTPAMAAAVFEELERAAPRRHFSVGIVDDVTHESLDVPKDFEPSSKDLYQAVFFGLGSDGTVGANKSTIKIIGDHTDWEVQGYFVYDSKKAGTVTVSHLRFGKRPFQAPYSIDQADFVACHQWDFLERLPVLDRARRGATILLNSPHGRDTWSHLPLEVQHRIVEMALNVHVIDARRIAMESELGPHVNTAMQLCFFALSGLMPLDVASAEMKANIERTYANDGAIVERNLKAIDLVLDRLEPLDVPSPSQPTVTAKPRRPTVPSEAPSFVQRVTAAMLAGHGDLLPVSAFPVDGTWPSATSQWEKRRLASEIPVWNMELCIQCNKCALACPHAAIRAKVYPAASDAPRDFKVATWKGPDLAGQSYTLQVAPEDCTGCRLCVEVCPAKDKTNPRRKALEMQPLATRLETERTNYQHFLALPEVDRRRVHLDVKNSQLFQPLFEYSGACAGCGETPYLKLLTQLFGDRLLIANATGCSSIYGANLPTTPYAVDAAGRGPAWANSLFEDNAEFGYGMRVGVDTLVEETRRRLRSLAGDLPADLVSSLLDADQTNEAGIVNQRRRVTELRDLVRRLDSPEARRLDELADYLVKKSVWLVGGDGWAYDIGFGGLDHVLASNRDVNVLVLDTQVYSNTGGQRSKATPMGAFAKFASSGKETARKDLGLYAMSYGHVYVASVALGAKDAQTLRAFAEAEAYPGPSLVIAYAPCIAHGYDLSHGAQHQKLAVDSGVWPLFRFDPRRADRGEPPLSLDTVPGKATVAEYMNAEGRFTAGSHDAQERSLELRAHAEREVARRTRLYAELASFRTSP
ncbi:MAG TPA: pyruvate:ferredoxin (flavodoxin) oxidoreductase [Polyangiaceae bacterium]|nr:pyruvate:ferredoxin (flavodoxin) oxidoreductase [Polyangiaceae bacterium]